MSKHHRNVALAAQYFSHICINIDEYIDMTLSNLHFAPFLDMKVDNESIAKGLYCKLLGANIWVSNIANDECIRVSNREEPSIMNEMDWSPNLKLDDFEKLLELKAFW